MDGPEFEEEMDKDIKALHRKALSEINAAMSWPADLSATLITTADAYDRLRGSARAAINTLVQIINILEERPS